MHIKKQSENDYLQRKFSLPLDQTQVLMVGADFIRETVPQLCPPPW